MSVLDRQFRQLVLYNVACNLKSETRKYALSYLWWAIEPSLHLLVLYAVFGIFFGQADNPYYIPFLFCGLVPWFWINKSVTNGLDSILGGRNLIKDTYIPKYFFPTVSIIQDSAKELFVFVILISTLILCGVTPTITWLMLPIVIILELLLISSLVYCGSIIIPYFLDLKYIVLTLLQVVMFGSGIFYDYQLMPESYQEIFLLNPVALLINMYRDILIYNRMIEIGNILYVFCFAIGFGIISYFLHKRLDKDILRVLYR